MMRYVYAHEPAMTRQEAALLSALPQRSTSISRSSMLWPHTIEGFISTTEPEKRADTNVSTRRGSVAGRAILTAAGISLPGVEGMRRGLCTYWDRQRSAEQWCAYLQ